MSPTEIVRHGVRRRHSSDVEPHQKNKIPHYPRDHGRFICDAVFEANREALERKYLSNRLRTR